MRIACWNCADGLWGKRALLGALDADLIIVPEVRAQDFARIAPGFAGAAYAPSASARGLASFCRLPGLQVRPFEPPGQLECYQWLHWQGVDILAAWVKSAGDYVRPARAAIGHFLQASKARHRIVLGDLNLNPKFDGQGRRRPATELVAHLAEQGLRSLYHEATGDPMGAEMQPTHHFTYNAARPFHIDFIFASQGLALDHFHIGAPADWIGKGRGDHVPLLAHLAPGPDR